MQPARKSQTSLVQMYQQPSQVKAKENDMEPAKVAATTRNAAPTLTFQHAKSSSASRPMNFQQYQQKQSLQKST